MGVKPAGQNLESSVVNSAQTAKQQVELQKVNKQEQDLVSTNSFHTLSAKEKWAVVHDRFNIGSAQSAKPKLALRKVAKQQLDLLKVSKLPHTPFTELVQGS